MILVLSSVDDQHAQAVMHELEANQADHALLDVSLVPSSHMIRWHLANGTRSFFLSGRNPIDLSAVRVVWWRRPQAPTLDPAITDPDYRLFAHTETHEAMTGMWSALDARWINPPHHDERASRKVYQLKAAQEVGLEIPETLVTSDPEAASVFVDSIGIGEVVFKAFSATQRLWRETRLVQGAERDQIDNVRYAPVIFQRFVSSTYDLRITIIGSQVFAAAIYAQETAYKVDMRMDIAHAEIAAVDLPGHVKDRLLKLMKRLGLVYGAVDMLLTPDGRYVFLEVNPAGQFLFIEARTGQPIAQTLAALMMKWARSGVDLPA